MRTLLTNLRIPTGGDTAASREILVVGGRVAEIT
jgi:hypothetical protein